jgi:S1-C subfamily serine protease
MCRSVWTTAAVGICSVGLLACGAAETRRGVAAPPSRMDLAVVAIDSRIGDATVHSSGVVVDSNRGLVLTSAHGVWGARSLKLTTALGLVHGRIIARAPCHDLAVLAFEPRIPGLASLPGSPTGDPADGQALRAVGRRRTDPRSQASGMAGIPVRAVGRERPQSLGPLLPTQPAAVLLDSGLLPEVSGGPVVDSAGRLVGMAQAANGSARALVVPMYRINSWLSLLRPGVRAVYSGWGDEYRCAPQEHAYARATYPGYNPADAKLNAPIRPTRVPGTENMAGG